VRTAATEETEEERAEERKKERRGEHLAIPLCVIFTREYYTFCVCQLRASFPGCHTYCTITVFRLFSAHSGGQRHLCFSAALLPTGTLHGIINCNRNIDVPFTLLTCLIGDLKPKRKSDPQSLGKKKASALLRTDSKDTRYKTSPFLLFRHSNQPLIQHNLTF